MRAVTVKGCAIMALSSIHYPVMTAFYAFKFGYLKIGYTRETVISLIKTDTIDCEDKHSFIGDLTNEQVNEYLDGQRKTFDFPFVLNGTYFQKRVWNALLDIPYGETRTYAQIAAAIDNPKAVRAVGLANGKNPIWIAVPCHRVIGTDGTLTGYAGGLEMKKALLELEQVYK